MSNDDIEHILLDILHEAHFDDLGATIALAEPCREIGPLQALIADAMLDLYASRPPQGQFTAI